MTIVFHAARFGIMYVMFLNGLCFRKKNIPETLILSEVGKEYRRFNAVGTHLTVRLIPPSDTHNNPVRNFLAGVKDV